MFGAVWEKGVVLTDSVSKLHGQMMYFYRLWVQIDMDR
jgi:hypothetical protein